MGTKFGGNARMHDLTLKADQEESMSEERRLSQDVEESSIILEISAWLYNQMRLLDDFT